MSVLGIVTLGLLMVAVVGWALVQKGSTPSIDKDSLCPKSGPSAVTVILIDTTDALNAIQRTAVQNRLNEVVGQLRQFEQVSVYPIGSTADLLKPTLIMCRPAKPEETSALTGNRALAQKRFEDAFQPKVHGLLEGAIDQPTSDNSPIMEAVQAVDVAVLQKFAAGGSGQQPIPKRLVIVSDMLENGVGGSHYRGVPDFAAFKASPAYPRVRSELEGLKVQILYIGRPNAVHIQGVSHIDFWEQWFKDQHATLENVKWIEG